MNHEGANFYPFFQILESLALYGVTTIYKPSESQHCFTKQMKVHKTQ